MSLYYGNNYSQRDIAKIFNCCQGTIRFYMNRYNIEARDKSVIIEPELLLSLYWGNKYNTYQIADLLKCSQSDIKYKMRKYGIPIRSKSKALSGENNGHWQGGKTPTPYGSGFDNKLKEKIRDRDGRKCQECGYTEKQLGYKLCIHHIDYNKQNHSKNNLISLCRSCHTQTNFSREDWNRYFCNKVNE